MSLEAAQQEFETLATGETPAETQETPVDMYELPVGEQTYKIPMNAELPIKHNGQIIKAPLETVLNTYRQKSHVEDKFKELNTEREAWKQQVGDFDKYNELKDKYEKIQAWSEQNPQDWERLHSMFQNKDQFLLNNAEDPNNAMVQKIQSLEARLEKLNELEQTVTSQQEESERQEALKEMDADKHEILKLHPNVDFEEKDMDGVSLETRIIQQGLKDGHQTFKAAFYTHPGLMTRLLETAQLNGRNETVKAVKQDTRDGVVARSATPFEAEGTQVDPRRLGEEERKDSALAELSHLMNNE